MKKLLLTILISTSLIGTASALTFSNNNTSKQSNNDTSKHSSSSNGIDRFGLISEIPEDANPNYETLKFYLYRYLYSHNIYPYCGSSTPELHCEDRSPYHAHLVESSDNPYQFHSDLREDKYVKKQMQETALLSYLLYEDGKIVIDEITPKDRFGDMFRDSSKFHSHSVGKTLVSYVAGHAICEGYIKSVDSRLDDWPVLENTLYHNQKLIDVLNMAAGTQEYFTGANKFSNSTRSVTTPTVQEAMENELKGSKKAYAKYNYVNLNPILVMSYILYKSGDDNFQQLLDDVFQKKARIEGDVFFLKNERAAKDDISVWNQFYATRYDYLRIAKAMLDDWQNDTCAGKYLKTIHDRRINKGNLRVKSKDSRVGMPKGYAGFFHTSYTGMNNRPVMGMDGYGGQTITIDFERGRIIATQAIHDNMMFPKPGSYDWKKIVYERIKNGKPASGVKQPPEPIIDPQQIILEKKTRIEAEKKSKQYWDDYYDAIFVSNKEAIVKEQRLKMHDQLTSTEASDAFDGSYSFKISLSYGGGISSKRLGNGYIEINNGIMTIAKEGRTLSTNSIDLYDSFKGRIDNKGNITSMLRITPMCGNVELQDLEFIGNIDRQLKYKCGEYMGFDLQVILKLGEKE